MGLTWAYGQPVDAKSERDALALLNQAVDLGVTLFDTSDMYGPFTNEELVGKALAMRRDEIVIATKCGLIVHGDRTNYDLRRDGTPQHIASACDASLQRLRVDRIDLYQLHRVDPNVPVEESVGAMAHLVQAGKVRAIGLSEVDVPTIERAARVHPIASVQSEYSLFERYVEPQILPHCETHGIALLAYAPLGRGMLTGRLTRGQIGPSDFRATLPRFQDRAFEHNRQIVEAVEAIAERLQATAAQVALAWLLAKSPNTVPIPGTKHSAYLRENVAGSALHLDAAALAQLDALPPPHGERYPEAKAR